VPTGAICTTANTALDFTTPALIGARINDTVNNCGTGCTGYDNAFILDRPRGSAREAADLTVLTLSSPETGIRLRVETNQQSLQIYTCNGLDGTIVAKQGQQHGDGSTTYGQFGCVVIETQQWIDGVNNPQWGEDGYQIYRVTDEPAVNLATYDFSVLW
jgi:aldose 1-epimerase